MAFSLVTGASSDVGPVRAVNQDSAYAGHRLAVVADGMGGHAAGEVASATVVHALLDLDAQAGGATATGSPTGAPAAISAAERLAAAVDAAQEELLARVAADPATSGMGTTLTAVLVGGERVALAHIGDSRAYRRTGAGGELQQVTRDDTFVQQLVDEGHISAAQAGVHPLRHAVTASLGDAGASTHVRVSEHDAVAGDRWLLCSDGVCGALGTDTLSRVLGSDLGPLPCAERLVELAVRAGATDNVTAVVIDVVDGIAGIAGTRPVGLVGAAAESELTPPSS